MISMSILTLYVSANIVLNNFVLSQQSKPVQVPTCNGALNSKNIVVHGDSWDGLEIQLYYRPPENMKCKNEAHTWFSILETSELKTLKDIECNPPVPNNTFFADDGSLTIVFGVDHHYYGKTDYCIMNANKTSIAIKYCQPSCGANEPCIKKCCPLGKSFDPLKQSCEITHGNEAWSPYIYSDRYSPTATNLDKAKFHPHFIYYLLDESRCSIHSTLDTFYSRNVKACLAGLNHDKFPFKLLQDGSLAYISNHRKWIKLDTEHFCIDAIQGYDPKNTTVGSSMESEQVVFTCAISVPEAKLSLVYLVSMYLASIFLLLTCIVYILLWDKQNVHGWTVFSLVLSMFFMFIFLGTAHLYGLVTVTASQPPEPMSPANDVDCSQDFTDPITDDVYREEISLNSTELVPDISTSEDTHSDEDQCENANIHFSPSRSFFCVLNAILAHFFFLSTFTWLTLINFDLFLTFKQLTSVAGRSKGLKKFFSYAVISWGLPLIVIIVGIVLDYKYDKNRESLVLTPEYGQSYCFIAPWAQGVYLYFIVSALLAVNFVLVGSTFFSLYQVKKLTGSIRSSKTNNKRETFMLVAKLSVVMGITWIFEVISWATTKEYADTAWYWVIFDMFNLFQAVLIFIIFVCKRKIVNQLEQKYPIFKRIFSTWGCSKLNSCLSSIRKRPGVSNTDASTGNTHSTDNDPSWSQNSIALNSLKKSTQLYSGSKSKLNTNSSDAN